MNLNQNKILQAEYVHTLNTFIQEGKQIVWIDETTFNLFCVEEPEEDLGLVQGQYKYYQLQEDQMFISLVEYLL